MEVFCKLDQSLKLLEAKSAWGQGSASSREPLDSLASPTLSPMDFNMAIRRSPLFNEVAVEALPCGLFLGAGEEAASCHLGVGRSLVVSSPSWARLSVP